MVLLANARADRMAGVVFRGYYTPQLILIDPHTIY